MLIACARLNASKPSRAAGSDRPGTSKSSAGSSGLVQQRGWRWGEEGEEKKPRTPAAAVPRAWLGAAPMLGQRLPGPDAEHLPAAIIPLKQGRTKQKRRGRFAPRQLLHPPTLFLCWQLLREHRRDLAAACSLPRPLIRGRCFFQITRSWNARLGSAAS